MNKLSAGKLNEGRDGWMDEGREVGRDGCVSEWTDGRTGRDVKLS